jgi:trehalose 6-phosphate synthase
VAAARRKLIVVSNRGPVSFGRGPDGDRVARRGGGGLATALRSLVSHHDITWIASAMTDDDRAVAAESGHDAVDETARDGSPYRLRLVTHDREAYRRFYNVVANPTLWFLQHMLWDLARADVGDGLREAWEGGYEPVNRAFADAVAEELERDPGQAVFFHDYHLYLAPRLVRERFPDAVMAHFVHIPWPGSDAWSVLPGDLRVAVHDGLLANDVVGFHTPRWGRNFLRCCSDLLGAEVDARERVVARGGRRTLVVAHPIAVDPAEFEELARSEAVLERERALVAGRPERLVLRVDRTDPSKNVVRGLRAFGLFLDANPEQRGKVGMLALLDPSRQDIPQYEDYLAAIEREAEAVNGRHPGAVDLRVGDDFPQSLAAYKQFDVLLVNAVFDGLNLVSKEAPLVNERAGVVVLSENAGAHEEIGEWTVTVNPFDVEGQARAIAAALAMPEEERRRRVEAIRAHVREHDLEAWSEAVLADLDRVA